MNLDDATEHRREDGELVGWIVRAGKRWWRGIDILGRPLDKAGDWLEIEERLEERGLGFLAEPWVLELASGPVRVRLVEVKPSGIVAKSEDFGAIDAPVERYEIAWPAPPSLRPARADDPMPEFPARA